MGLPFELAEYFTWKNWDVPGVPRDPVGPVSPLGPVAPVAPLSPSSPFVALVTLHLRPRISGERRAIRSREVGVLPDVCARSFTVVGGKRRTIVRVLDV